MLEITEDVITQIMYAMENQNVNFYLDSQKMIVVEENSDTADDKEETRFWAIPPWKSSDGFNLMKQFAEQLKNALKKEELLAILTSRNKVFKRFKEAVKEEGLLEKRWYDYKEKHMRAIITDWYSIYTQASEMERITIKEYETEDLLLSDILITPASSGDDLLTKKWEKEALKELFKDYSENQTEKIRERIQIPETGKCAGKTYFARTPDGETVSFIRLFPWMERGDKTIYWIQMIYTVPEFRGLGLAKLLIQNIPENNLAAALPSSAEFLLEALKSRGFQVMITTLVL